MLRKPLPSQSQLSISEIADTLSKGCYHARVDWFYIEKDKRFYSKRDSMKNIGYDDALKLVKWMKG